MGVDGLLCVAGSSGGRLQYTSTSSVKSASTLSGLGGETVVGKEGRGGKIRDYEFHSIRDFRVVSPKEDAGV